MLISSNKRFRAPIACVVFACAIATPAVAVEVGGIQISDTAMVAGKELKLNGAGLRTRFLLKVYAAALYLPEKKSAVADIAALPGPRRVTLVMTRNISSDDFGNAFMTGLNNNTDKSEKTRIISQTSGFGEKFALLPGLKKGDVLNLDWIPGSGTQCKLNGKDIGTAMPDIAFYNAVLKIWLGDNPVDRALKPQLLGVAK